jgi:hypothetical protein
MPLPPLTQLQFLVVSRLVGGSVPGRDLREHLKSEAIRQSGPAFYQMMSVLEDGGFVSGWYEQQIIDGQIIRERHYKLLANGKTAWQKTRDFYARVSGDRRLGPAHGTS